MLSMCDVRSLEKIKMLGRLIGLILAKFFSPMASFLIIIMIARVWGKTNLGQYTTILAWLAIFQFVTTFGIGEYIAREVGKDPSTAAKYLTHALFFGLVSSVICIGLMVSGVTFFQYSPEVKYGVMIASLALPVTSWSLMCQSVFVALQKITYIAVTSILESSVVLLFGIIIIQKHYGIIALILSLLLARCLGSALNIILIHLKITPLRFRIEKDFFIKLLLPVAVFGLTGVASQIFMRLDVIMLSWLKDMTMVGLYSSAGKLTEICTMLPVAFYILNLPVAANNYKNYPDKAYLKIESYTSVLFILVFFIFGFGITFAEVILEFTFGRTYIGAAWPLRILLLAYLIHSGDMILGMSCQAAGFQNFVMYTAVIRAFSNMVLNLILIPILAIEGAAFATLVSIVLSFIILQNFSIKNLHKFNWMHIVLKPFLVCLLTMVLLFSLTTHLNILMQGFVYLFGYIGIYFLMNKIFYIRTQYA